MKEGMLSYYCKVIAGQSPIGNSYNSESNGMEFHQGKKSFGATFLRPSGIWTTMPTKIAEKGDILMSVRAPVGPTNLTDRQVCIGRGLAAIRCNDNALSEYILYALKNIESKITGNNGAVFNSINKKMIEELPVPIATIDEQQRIVSHLDSSFAKIDALKTNAGKMLDEAKALFASALREAMKPKEGWEEKRLGEVCSSITDGDHQPPPKVEKGIPFITISNVDKELRCVDFSKTYYVPKEYFDNVREERKPKKNDILYTVTGSFGIPIICNYDQEFVFQRHIALLRPINKIIESAYMYYWLLSPMMQKEADNVATGAAQRTVSLSSLRKFIVLFPTKEEQTRIVAHLDNLSAKVRQLEANFKKVSEECDALKQAILRETFE